MIEGDTTGVWQQGDQDLVATLANLETQKRRIDAQQTAILAEIRSRGPLATYGYSSLKTLQVDLLRIAPREADTRVKRAEALYPPTDTGVVTPRAPETVKAMAAGVIGVEHADHIITTLAAFPAVVPVEEVKAHEQTLLDLAKQCDPRPVAKAGRHLRALVEQDYGQPPDEKELARPERELRMAWRRDGRLGLTGILDQEAGRMLQTLLSPLTKPRPAENGERDPRPLEQRYADGFADLLDIAHRATERPTEAGERPTVVVTLNYESLTKQLANSGFATVNGEPITAGQARRLACDAKIIPAVLGTHSEVLDLGRTERLATLPLRRALELRDKGCVKCGRPPKWCQAHHIAMPLS